MTASSDRLSFVYSQLSGGPGIFSLDFLLATSHHERLKVIRKAVDWIVQDHVQTRNLRQGRSEDELTIDVVSGLRAMGFHAWHDAQIGGHTDISVDGKDAFLWLCEAKKHSSYDWLLEGFVQLGSYCPGLIGQDAADILIYHYAPNSAAVMEQWIAHLDAAELSVEVLAPTDDTLTRFTSHTHVSSGRKLQFRHKMVPLYWEQLKKSKAKAKQDRT